MRRLFLVSGYLGGWGAEAAARPLIQQTLLGPLIRSRFCGYGVTPGSGVETRKRFR